MHRRSIDSDHFDPMYRPTSPILFSKHSHQQHASRAADISRLLDPSYSSSSSSTSSTSSHHVHAYVDRFGELHDPDYRYFPVAAPTKRTTSPHRAAYNMAARPRWELIDEDALDIEEEEEDFSAQIYHRQQHNTHSSKRHTRDSFSSLHRTYTPTPAPAPASFDSDDTVLDEYDENDAEDAAFVARERDTRFPSLLRTTFTRDRKRRPSSLLSDAPTPALTPASASPASPTTATTATTGVAAQSSHSHSLPASPLSPHTSLFAHYPVRTVSRQHQNQNQYELPDRDKETREQEERERRERELDEEM
ncbi:hypothetical protein BDZ94DRAFT_1260550, partial [Collybia nuda]